MVVLMEMDAGTGVNSRKDQRNSEMNGVDGSDGDKWKLDSLGAMIEYEYMVNVL